MLYKYNQTPTSLYQWQYMSANLPGYEFQAVVLYIIQLVI